LRDNKKQKNQMENLTANHRPRHLSPYLLNLPAEALRYKCFRRQFRANFEKAPGVLSVLTHYPPKGSLGHRNNSRKFLTAGKMALSCTRKIKGPPEVQRAT